MVCWGGGKAAGVLRAGNGYFQGKLPAPDPSPVYYVRVGVVQGEGRGGPDHNIA